MDDNIIESILEIVQMALIINPTPTLKSETGKKPTVFFNFLGHCSYFEVVIDPEGWDSNYSTPREVFQCYFDDEDAEETLEAIKKRLNIIMADVIRGRYSNDTV